MIKNKNYNVEVLLKSNESPEKFIKRFFRKCKKLEIVKEHLEKTSFYVKKSDKKRMKKSKNKFINEKIREESKKNANF